MIEDHVHESLINSFVYGSTRSPLRQILQFKTMYQLW